MTILLLSKIAHVINNVMTTRVITPTSFPLAIVINRITIRFITLVNSNQYSRCIPATPAYDFESSNKVKIVGHGQGTVLKKNVAP